MLQFQRICLAEGGHIGAQVIEPDLLGIALVRSAAGKEQHISLDPLGVENAGGQAQDGMQITLVHQVNADFLTLAVGKEDVIRQDHSGAGLSVPVQTAVNVL